MLRSGAALMIYASACFAVMAAVVKHLSVLPAVELMLVRALLALPVLAVVLLRQRPGHRLPRNKRLMGARIVLGGVAITLGFFAIGKLPIADASMLAKMQPLWVALLAPVVLKERANSSTMFCIAIALIGVALVLRPSMEISVAGGLAMVAATLASSVAHMTVRRMGATDAPEVIVFWFMAGTAVLALPAIPIMVWPSPTQWGWLAVMAAAAVAGQLLATRAYRTEEAPVVSAAGYTSVVYGVLLGVFIWDDVVSPFTWAGGAILIVSGVALVWSRRRVSARTFGAPAPEPMSGSTPQSR